MKYLTEKDRYLIEKSLQQKIPVKKIADEVTAYTAGEDGVGRYLLDRLHLEGE